VRPSTQTTCVESTTLNMACLQQHNLESCAYHAHGKEHYRVMCMM
jgi:hypothetical protein